MWDYLSNKPNKKVVFLWGPRRVGKSTILNELFKQKGGAYFNFDDIADQNALKPDLNYIKQVINLRTNNKDSKYIFIDEVQKSPQVTQSIKLLTDTTDYVVIATGSSELRAKGQNFDTLAGRYKEFVLFPLTIDEYANFILPNGFEMLSSVNEASLDFLSTYLEDLMIFGSYPQTIGLPAIERAQELKSISGSAVVKDIVEIYGLKNPSLVFDLLRTLSLQIGNLINIAEISNLLKTSHATISSYLDILSKNRIIYLLEPYKTNKRSAYKERKKVYFYDLGIRNSFIEDFRPLNVRGDIGAMFENLIVMGFVRQNIYYNLGNKFYYYRQAYGAGREVDLIVETFDGDLHAYEIKYSWGEKAKNSKIKQTLPLKSFQIIDKNLAAKYLI